MAKLMQDDGFDVIGLEHNQVRVEADFVAPSIMTAFRPGTFQVHSSVRKAVFCGIAIQQVPHRVLEQIVDLPLLFR